MFFYLKKYSFLFFKGSRIKTWPISLVPVFMASALAFKQTEKFNLLIFVCTSLSVLFIQITVNLFNDALDGKAGLDTTGERLGPARLVGSKQATFFEIQALGFLSGVLAILIAIPLIVKTGVWILMMGVLSLLACYFYTGTQYSLLKLGLSELCAVVFFGFFIVCGSYYLQTLNLSEHLLYLSLQCGFWSLFILLINHLRDEKLDKKMGRKHLVTVYGRVHSLFFMMAIQAFIYLLCFYWMGSFVKAGAFSFFIAPLSAYMLYQLSQETPQQHNRSLALSTGLYMLFASSWIFGLLF